MALLLRALSNSNVKWESAGFPEWLPNNELPSDLLKDLRTDNNQLSVWQVKEDKSNLDEVITAIASKRKTLKDNLDYALIKKEIIEKNKFVCLATIGNTAYTSVNIYHLDISNLSTENIVQLAHLLFEQGKFDRKGWKSISTLVKNAFLDKKIDSEKIDPKLRENIESINQ